MQPSVLADLAYDAASIARVTAQTGGAALTTSLTRPGGFSGAGRNADPAARRTRATSPGGVPTVPRHRHHRGPRPGELSVVPGSGSKARPGALPPNPPLGVRRPLPHEWEVAHRTRCTPSNSWGLGSPDPSGGPGGRAPWPCLASTAGHHALAPRDARRDCGRVPGSRWCRGRCWGGLVVWGEVRVLPAVLGEVVILVAMVGFAAVWLADLGRLGLEGEVLVSPRLWPLRGVGRDMRRRLVEREVVGAQAQAASRGGACHCGVDA